MGVKPAPDELVLGRHLPRTGSTSSQTDRDGTNGVVLQMGVALSGWGLTMPEHLADAVDMAGRCRRLGLEPELRGRPDEDF